jgi:hypothetical protein
MQKRFFLAWNGCDAHTETDGSPIYRGPHTFPAFEVVPARIDDVPLDDDGEHDFTGFFLTDSGNVYRAV